MDKLIQFKIPVSGLKIGIHPYQFKIDKAFFKAFENTPIENGNVDVVLHFDKRESLFVLNFEIAGTVKTDCDRCLTPINLPIECNDQLLVKFSEIEKEEDEVIYVAPGIQELNVAKYIYEFIVLALPVMKIYDCENDENPPCNEDMLDHLDQNQDVDETKAPESNIWEELKKFKK